MTYQLTPLWDEVGPWNDRPVRDVLVVDYWDLPRQEGTLRHWELLPVPRNLPRPRLDTGCGYPPRGKFQGPWSPSTSPPG